MLTGGPFQPYPRVCPNAPLVCNYKHAKLTDNTVARWDLLGVTVPQWNTCPEVSKAPIKPYERFSNNADCDNAVSCPDNYTCADGVTTVAHDCFSWIGTGLRQYSLVGGQSNTVPNLNTRSALGAGGAYQQQQMCVKLVVANGGANYQRGDIIYPPDGTAGPVFGAQTATFVVGLVDGTGKILSASIQAGGLYTTNPATTCHPIGSATGSGAILTLTFAGATISFGECEQRGWKGVDARLWWYGQLPWTSHDGAPCNDVICSDPSKNYEGYQPTAAQVKYKTYSISASYEESYNPGVSTGGAPAAHTSPTVMPAHLPNGPRANEEPLNYDSTSTANGSITIDENSGQITNSVYTTKTKYVYPPDSGQVLSYYSAGGSGYDSSATPKNFVSGGQSDLDAIVGGDVHCSSPSGGVIAPLESWIASWNEYEGMDGSPLPPITNLNFYSGSATYSNDSLDEYIAISWSRTATSYNWSILYTSGLYSYSNYGTISLSNPYSNTQIQADAGTLLNYWDLTDNARYPWRLDGLMQVNPLMSKNQVPGNRTPCEGFIPWTMNDLRYPIADSFGRPPFTTSDPAFVAGSDPPFVARSGNYDSSGRPPSDPDYNSADTYWASTYQQIRWLDSSVYQFQFGVVTYNGQTSDGTGFAEQIAIGLVRIYDGAIQGAPLPSGFVDYFRFDFPDWRSCCVTGGDDPHGNQFYIYGYGMYLSNYISATGAQLPLCTTQWTNNKDVIVHPPFAFISYADKTIVSATCANGGTDTTGDGAFWARKFACIKENWQAQNYARPAGDDKFRYRECDDSEASKVYAATNVSGSGAGSVWALLTYAGNVPAMAAGDLIGYFGGKVLGSINPADAGFYVMGGYDFTTGYMTLGAKVYNLPSNWPVSNPAGDTAQCFAALRFPNAPSLLGRQAHKLTGNIATFDVAQPAFAMAVSSTEQVDILDAKANVLASNVTATRPNGKWMAGTAVALNQLVVNSAGYVQQVATAGTTGSIEPDWSQPVTNDNGVIWKNIGQVDTVFVLPANYALAKWVVIHGVNWEFNSSYPRGNFLALEWTHDYRTNGENYRLTVPGAPGAPPPSGCSGEIPPIGTPAANFGFSNFKQTTYCLPLCSKAPRVLCWSPNAEVWRNGITLPFPAFQMDERYGSKWQAQLQQTMTDLLWQRPHTPLSAPSLNPLDDEGTITPGQDITWVEDDGTCHVDTFVPDDAGGGTTTMYFPLGPLVEAEVALPHFGLATPQTDTPTLPTGITLGWKSPVYYSDGVQPPPPCGYDANTGDPFGASAEWQLRSNLKIACAVGSICRFKYDYSQWFLP